MEQVNQPGRRGVTHYMRSVLRFHPLLLVGGLTLVAYLVHVSNLGPTDGLFGMWQYLLAPVQLTGLGLLAAGAPLTPLLGILALSLFLGVCLLLDRATFLYFQSWARATKPNWPS